MNLLFFLTPKSEVAYINSDDTMKEAICKMKEHKYATIPLIDQKGKYVGTISEGDFLWEIVKNDAIQHTNLGRQSVLKVKRKADYKPVSIGADLESLVLESMNQNFVPVVDDGNIFIGIVTRKDIIQYCYNKFIKDSEQRSS